MNSRKKKMWKRKRLSRMNSKHKNCRHICDKMFFLLSSLQSLSLSLWNVAIELIWIAFFLTQHIDCKLHQDTKMTRARQQQWIGSTQVKGCFLFIVVFFNLWQTSRQSCEKRHLSLADNVRDTARAFNIDLFLSQSSPFHSLGVRRIFMPHR